MTVMLYSKLLYVIGIVLILTVASCEQKTEPVDRIPQKVPTVSSEKKLKTKEEVSILLPPHKFNPTSQPGRSKSQIRAIVSLGTLTESDFKELAVQLCNKYKNKFGSFLVQFFDDKSCLSGWDGTGLLKDSDWPHWLCRISVETNSSGKLYANTFKLAIDGVTGLERTDVLKK